MGKDPGSIPMDEPLTLLRGSVEKPGRFRQPDAKRDRDDVMEQFKTWC